MKRSLLSVILCVFAAVATVSCTKAPPGDSAQGKIRVVTTLFVLYDFAKAVGGDHAEVRMLIPPGIEPHGFEPTPGDMVRIQKADLFIYTGRAMEPWVDSLLVAPDMQKTTVVEAGRSIGIDAGAKGHANDGERHRDGQDPHVWLDLSNAQKMVDTIRDGFIEKDSPHREQYRANADAYKAQLAALDERFRAVLSSCKKKVVIYGGHAAFSYLANRYGLRFVAAYRGFSPDAEPTPRRIAEMADKMKRYGLGHVFYEELVSPRVAETIARETGATLLLLHGAHNVSKNDMEEGVAFLSLMERNLTGLRAGLQCP